MFLLVTAAPCVWVTESLVGHCVLPLDCELLVSLPLPLPLLVFLGRDILLGQYTSTWLQLSYWC